MAARDFQRRFLGRRMRTPLAMTLPQMSRLVHDDHSGTCKNLIGTRFTTVMKGAMVFVVWDSSTTAVASPEPKDDS